MDDSIGSVVRAYILKEFLPDESPDLLTDSTPLITGGILDSLGTMKLVAFIEERFAIELEAQEASFEHMNTVADIAKLVRSKME